MINQEILECNLSAYNYANNKRLQFSYQDLQRAFEERDFSVLGDEFSKFVEWYGDAGKTVNRYE